MKETFKKILVNITVLFNYCNFCIKIHQFLFKYNESIISPEWGKLDPVSCDLESVRNNSLNNRSGQDEGQVTKR